MKYKLIVIGTSAGGVSALQKIFELLPEDFKTPVLIVQHIPSHARIELELVFGRFTKRKIREIEDKMPVEAGLFFAPPSYHTLVERDLTFALSEDDLVNFSRPSIDVCFESVAYSLGANAIGILLTGANNDGAMGLKAMSEAGALTIVEDPKTAEVKTMPQSAIDVMKPDYIVPLTQIAELLIKIEGENRG